MFSKRATITSTATYSAQIDRLRRELDTADAVVIGAGAGLSTSAGFAYSGERFKRYFADFAAKYGFHDMYTGGFYPYATPEENWAYWSRYIYINRYMSAPKPTYDKLYELVRDKDYFVLTTNVDHQFQKAGFDKKRLFYTQGDYGLWQCSAPCHAANRRYDDFLRRHEGGHILFLELGVGMNTPVIIKYPFWRMTAQNLSAVYACLNYGEALAPGEIKDRSICINGDIGEILNKLYARKN